MAHALDMSTGDAAMAYVGSEGTPWHNLGRPIPEGSTPQQITKLALLDWLVKRSAVQFSVDGKKELGLDIDHQVLYRSDTKAVLDITGKGYIPHQNHEVMQFFQEYVEAGDMTIDVAGALNGGKQIWVLAKMGKSFTLPGKDKVGGYVLLMNPHQYGKGMIAKMTMIRVVCRNTLMAALSGGGGLKIWHTKEFNGPRQQEAKEKLGIARERFDAIKQDSEALVKITMAKDDALKVFAKVTGNDPTDALEDQPRTVQRLMELYMGAGKGADMLSAAGTAWGALNAVTQWVDHEYGRSQNARLNNAWLGRGDVMKRETLGLLLQDAAA